MFKAARTATLLALLVLPTTSRGDTGSDGSAIDGATPDATHPSPGPAAALWHRDDLPPTERAYVDRAANPTGRDAVAAAYAAAVAEHIPAYEAQAAATQLGLEGLDQEGVVP